MSGRVENFLSLRRHLDTLRRSAPSLLDVTWLWLRRSAPSLLDVTW
ncbi:MAG: hypothetical protein WD094_00805 [Balneolaceae bacterium]